MAVVTALTPDQVPIARPRSLSSNAALTSARLLGASKAAPIPWNARAAMSNVAFGAIPHRTEAMANR